MEQFLEIILQVEKEAGGIEDKAAQSLVEIESEYCLALAQMEAASLKELYQNLAKQKKEQTVEITRLGQKISDESEMKCKILENAGKNIEKASAELVVHTLLPEGI
jgi:hypothetical protein